MSANNHIVRAVPDDPALITASTSSDAHHTKRLWPWLQIVVFGVTTFTLLTVLLAMRSTVIGQLVLAGMLLSFGFIGKALLFGLVVRFVWHVSGRIAGHQGGSN